MRATQGFGRVLLFGLTFIAFGCSGGGGGGSSSGPTGGGSGDGTITVLLTDSPFTEATAVLVTFSEVQVHHTGAGWITLPFSGGATSRTCDLKKLTGATDLLGAGFATGGHYTMIRLVVSSATLYNGGSATVTAFACNASATPLTPTESPTAAPVDVPSGEIKLNREFDLASGGTKNILLDFDGDTSIRERGNGTFFMQPVIAVVSVS